MRKILSIILLLQSATVLAQDPHFSQYFASPLTINPAHTGNINEDLRAIALYRQQWWSVGTPYNTGTISYEQKLLKNSLDSKNRFGIGGMFMFDESLGGGLKSSYLSLSTSYHIGLNSSGTSRIGVGFQGTFGNRRINLSKLSFENQFSSGGFNLNLPTGENSLSNLKSFFDLNAGLIYSLETENNKYSFGFSTYHITTPKQTITGDEDSRIPRRYNLQGSADISLKNSDDKLLFSFLYMNQAKATSVNLGAAYQYQLGSATDNKFLIGGIFYRFNDAIYPYLSYKNKNYQFSLSYDAVVSDLRLATPRTGSMELSVIYAPNFK